MGGPLIGKYHVRVYRPAFKEAKKLFPRVADYMEVRQHALKLRFWPRSGPGNRSGQLLDLDWEWVQSISTNDVGELRIHDVIAGNDNLRIIFHVFDSAVEEKKPLIFILKVFQKKSYVFTKREIDIFKERRRQVRKGFSETG